jgi:hypothetical protein
MSRKRFAFIPFQHPILPKWIPFAADQSMDWVAPRVRLAQHQLLEEMAAQQQKLGAEF